MSEKWWAARDGNGRWYSTQVEAARPCVGPAKSEAEVWALAHQQMLSERRILAAEIRRVRRLRAQMRYKAERAALREAARS